MKESIELAEIFLNVIKAILSREFTAQERRHLLDILTGGE